MPFLAAIPAAWGALGVGTQAAIGGIAAAGLGAGLSSVLAPNTHFAIPPPPGASLISSAGQTAAADARRRAAAAGGLGSTITGAGAAAANAGPTSGGKTLLGQ